ncbi:MAG TPA: hypothetical protein VL179_04495, partial [Mycobacterium sp.]|nr:hypothetical protein [Mycobacterium sp.]
MSEHPMQGGPGAPDDDRTRILGQPLRDDSGTQGFGGFRSEQRFAEPGSTREWSSTPALGIPRPMDRS